MASLLPVRLLSRAISRGKDCSCGVRLFASSVVRLDSAPCLRSELIKDVKWLSLNSPQTRNSLSLQMLRELRAGFSLTKEESHVRAIVINAPQPPGTKSPVFSSGHNLKELRLDTERPNSSAQKEIFETCSDVMALIRQSTVPVLCEVNGLAAAAGCQLVASCDIVVASEASSFSTPGANFGLFCSTPGVAVARAATAKTAALMLLTGQPVSAQDALRAGLVSLVVPEVDLRRTTESILSAICSKSRSVIELGRKFYLQQIQMTVEDAYGQGGCVMLENLSLKDCQEGLTAFVEKRKPVWTHTNEKVSFSK